MCRAIIEKRTHCYKCLALEIAVRFLGRYYIIGRGLVENRFRFIVVVVIVVQSNSLLRLRQKYLNLMLRIVAWHNNNNYIPYCYVNTVTALWNRMFFMSFEFSSGLARRVVVWLFFSFLSSDSPSTLRAHTRCRPAHTARASFLSRLLASDWNLELNRVLSFVLHPVQKAATVIII